MNKTIAYQNGNVTKLQILGFFLLISFFTQMLIAPSISSFVSCSLIVLSSFITFVYIFNGKSKFQKFPLSLFTILSFNFSTQSGALFFQSVSLKSVTYNLFTPVETFYYLFLFQISIILAHFFYSNFYSFRRLKNTISNKIFKQLGLFDELPAFNIWVFGFLGMVSIWFSATSSVVYGDIIGKAFLALIPFVYFPYLLLFKKNVASKKLVLLMFIYTLALIILGIVSNSRGIFATGIIIILFVSYIFYEAYKYKITKRTIFKLLFICIISLSFLSILSDLALSMIIVRSERDEVTGWALFLLTINTLLDGESLERYKIIAQGNIYKGYNEVYLDNPYIARFITTKFEDTLIYYSLQLTIDQSLSVLVVTIDKIFALLPTPLLSILGANIDKKTLEFTITDYVWFLHSGVGLGGYRVSPLLGHGLAIFGLFYFIITIFVLPFFFVVLDSFTNTIKNKLVYSPLILISLYSLYQFLTIGSLISPIAFLFRAMPQLILYYVLINFICNTLRRLSFYRPNS